LSCATGSSLDGSKPSASTLSPSRSCHRPRDGRRLSATRHQRRPHSSATRSLPVRAMATGEQPVNSYWGLAEHSTPVRFLIRDRDGKFTRDFDTVFRSEEVEIIQTPVRAPKANAVAERFVRTVRSECLDWLLVLNRRHLERALRVFADHYNGHRPHRALSLTPPEPKATHAPARDPIAIRPRRAPRSARRTAARIPPRGVNRISAPHRRGHAQRIPRQRRADIYRILTVRGGSYGGRWALSCWGVSCPRLEF
jgi:hypothetical protein